MTNILVFIFMWSGIIFSYVGYQFITNKSSHIRAGKVTHFYAGNLALIHGWTYSFIGLFCLIWAGLGWWHIIQPDGKWIWIGIGIPVATLWIMYLALSLLQKFTQEKN